jgi:hypothetical protein
MKYHSHIRNLTIAIGSLLTNLNISMNKSHIPVSFAAKNRFVAKLKNTPNGVQTFLPRIGFNLETLSYDSVRQKQTNKRLYNNDISSLTPVPYNVGYTISIYTKSMDESLEIIEQILPSFTPSFNIKFKENEELDIVSDVPISLEGVSLEDNWEGSFEGSDLRTIIWELSLTAEINLFPETKSNIPLIENVILNFGNLNDDNWYYESPNIEFTGFCALIAEATII